jgi:hypothetical protein
LSGGEVLGSGLNGVSVVYVFGSDMSGSEFSPGDMAIGLWVKAEKRERNEKNSAENRCYGIVCYFDMLHAACPGRGGV